MAFTTQEIYDLNNMNVAAQNVELGTLLDELEVFDTALLSATAGVATASKAAILGTTKNLDTLVIADGGFKLGAGAGTAVTATAAELNLIDGSIAGTAVASKALSLGATKNVDVLVVADGGLSLGAGAGTAITSTAAELNLIDGSIAGTAVVSKALVLGATKNVDTLVIADSGLFLGAGAGTAVTKTAAQLNTVVVGVAGGYMVARSAAPVALDGSNPTSVAHGLTTCVSATVQLVGSAAPGVGTSVLTCVINGANIDVYAWKVTGVGDTTLIASTGTETFNWVAVGV